MNRADDDDLELRKSSTMNSMFIGSTISKPNVESIINAVATILHSQMLEVSLFHFIPIFYILIPNMITFREFRIKTKERKSNKTVNYFASLRKSISSRNQMPSITRESPC